MNQNWTFADFYETIGVNPGIFSKAMAAPSNSPYIDTHMTPISDAITITWQAVTETENLRMARE